MRRGGFLFLTLVCRGPMSQKEIFVIVTHRITAPKGKIVTDELPACVQERIVIPEIFVTLFLRKSHCSLDSKGESK